MKNNTPFTKGLLIANLMADFIAIAIHECDINELERVQKCLEIFNRKHGCCCDSELDELNDNIYHIKHNDMIREKLLDMMAEGKINLNGCQVNLGDGSTQNNYYADKVNDTRKSNAKYADESECSTLPDAFRTTDGVALMEKLKQGNLIDDDFQPIGMSWTEKSILVDELSSRLHIEDKWQVFGSLWHLKPQSLRSAYNKAMDMKKTAVIFDRIRNVIPI